MSASAEGNHDDYSAFFAECKELAYVLKHANQRSLVLVREAQRGGCREQTAGADPHASADDSTANTPLTFFYLPFFFTFFSVPVPAMARR